MVHQKVLFKLCSQGEEYKWQKHEVNFVISGKKQFSWPCQTAENLWACWVHHLSGVIFQDHKKLKVCIALTCTHVHRGSHTLTTSSYKGDTGTFILQQVSTYFIFSTTSFQNFMRDDNWSWQCGLWLHMKWCHNKKTIFLWPHAMWRAVSEIQPWIRWIEAGVSVMEDRAACTVINEAAPNSSLGIYWFSYVTGFALN